MKIEVTLTEEIFRRFTMFDILRRRKMWKAPVIFAAILAVSAAICFLKHEVDGAVFLGTVLLIVGLGMPCLYFVTFFLSLRKQVIVLGLKRPQQVYTLELTTEEKGIHIQNEKEKADYPWKAVYHVYKTPLATYLYMTSSRAFLLPNSSVEDPEALWALMTKMVPKEKCTVL